MIRENCFSVVLLWVKTTIQKKGKLNIRSFCFADVNECITEKHNCNNGSSICHNTKGSFRCICREPGYFWNEVNCTGKYILYTEIVDSSAKKRSLCDRGLSNGENIVIIVIIDIAVIPPFSLILKTVKITDKKRRFVSLLMN